MQSPHPKLHVLSKMVILPESLGSLGCYYYVKNFRLNYLEILVLFVVVVVLRFLWWGFRILTLCAALGVGETAGFLGT